MSPEQELEKLIGEQSLDMIRGHRVSRPKTKSLDAYDYSPVMPKVRRFRIPLSAPDPRHGTKAGYSAGCKCKRCKKAESRYRLERNKILKETPFDEIPHGTTNGYRNYGCRCIPCTAANTKSWNNWNQKKRAA